MKKLGFFALSVFMIFLVSCANASGGGSSGGNQNDKKDKAFSVLQQLEKKAEL